MLNPTLYKRLAALYGEVKIANENEPIIIHRREENGRSRPWKVQGGEEYRVCCPDCGDTRHRLYVNHAYGTDVVVGYPAHKLVVCHNEHCESNGRLLEDLKRGLYSYFNRAKRENVLLPSEDMAPREPLPFPKPEWTIPLTQLPQMHPASIYLAIRNFDREELEKRWGVVYCDRYEVDKREWLGGRLFIPCGGMGWQARAVGDSKIKYYTCHGWKKTESVYNLSEARKAMFCVVMEGVTKVWRLGPTAPGVAIYGKRISEKQVEMLSRNFDRVLLVLDNDAYESTALKLSDGDHTLALLSRRIPKTLRIKLPVNDPGDMTKDALWDQLMQQASANGYKEVLRV